MALVEEPSFQRDLRDAVAGIPQPRGGPGEPQPARVGPDRGAVAEAENPGIAAIAANSSRSERNRKALSFFLTPP